MPRPAFLVSLAAAVALLIYVRTRPGNWSLPAAAEPFADLLARATAANGLPPLLLARVAYQESRFRPDIIYGPTVSSAGAKGIVQIVTKWHPGVDPWNPEEAIPYAARYLRKLRDELGSWRLALAAYNWGIGNVKKWKAAGGVGAWPEETERYVREISRDVGLAA